MFKNYLKISIRILIRQKGYTFIKILGLAAGIACCLLIALYVLDELSYDRFHQKFDRIYRVVQDLTGDMDTLAAATGTLGPASKEDLPEVLRMARFTIGNPEGMEQNAYLCSRGIACDFLNLCDLDVIAGRTPSRNCNSSSALVVNETAAAYYRYVDPDLDVSPSSSPVWGFSDRQRLIRSGAPKKSAYGRRSAQVYSPSCFTSPGSSPDSCSLPSSWPSCWPISP